MTEEIKKEDLNQKIKTEDQIENTETQEEQIEVLPETDLVAEIKDLEEKLSKANKTIEEQKDFVIRSKAENENVKRRAIQDIDKAHKFALEKFANALLPVIDNLERAVEHADQENEAVKPMIEGVELTLKSFTDVIENFDMKQINPMGEPLDPNKHQAMGMQPSDEVEPNTVIMVMQKGYELNGRVIRPAMVMVASKPITE